VTITQLAHDEPLSPELVLVLPPELRAQAVAALGPPVWPQPRPRLRITIPAEPEAVEPAPVGPVPLEPAPVELEPAPVELEPAPVELERVEPAERFGHALGRVLAARVVQLGVIFAAATVITLALSLVAHALRTP
jgi:hypothetical protein